MRKSLLLLAAPLPVWIAWGIADAANPAAAMDYFPYFWWASDIALAVMFIVLLLWATDYGTPRSEGKGDASSSRSNKGGEHGHP